MLTVVKWFYSYAGLTISSSIRLPEWNGFSLCNISNKPDVEIHTYSATAPFAEEHTQSITADEYMFIIPRIGKYRVTRGSIIEVTHLPNIEPLKMRIFLLGSAWGALCYQRGMLALHAGSVQIENHAILLCAPQGKGKSTLTASLVSKGHNLISDDLCCVDISERGVPTVYPSTQRLRLCGDSLRALGWEQDNLQSDFKKIDKYQVSLISCKTNYPVALKSIYILDWGELGIKRVTGINAIQSFISAATYRGNILQEMNLSTAYWQQCLELLKKIPLWILTRPKDFEKMGTVISELEQHISTIK